MDAARRDPPSWTLVDTQLLPDRTYRALREWSAAKR